MSLDPHSRLRGVHPDLVRVIEQAHSNSDVDFVVTEGLRSVERQRELLAKGATRTMNSRHLTGHAVDVAAVIDAEIRWDWPLYSKIAKAVEMASQNLGIPVVWGGSWKTFKDGPHFELDRKKYP